MRDRTKQGTRFWPKKSRWSIGSGAVEKCAVLPPVEEFGRHEEFGCKRKRCGGAWSCQRNKASNGKAEDEERKPEFSSFLSLPPKKFRRKIYIVTEPSWKIYMSTLGIKVMKEPVATHHRTTVSQILKSLKVCLFFFLCGEVQPSTWPLTWLYPFLFVFTGWRHSSAGCLSVRACKSRGNSAEARCQHSRSTLCELFDTHNIDSGGGGTNVLLLGQQQTPWLQRTQAFAKHCSFIVLYSSKMWILLTVCFSWCWEK